MRGGRRAAAALARGVLAGALVAAVSACGVPAEDHASFVPPDEVPFGLLGTAAAPTSTADGSGVPVCLVRSDRLVTVDHAVPPPVTPRALLEAAAAPVEEERRQGLSTALPDDAVAAVDQRGGTVTVALTDDFPRVAADAQLLAVAQMVCTLTAQADMQEVRFTIQGAPVEVPRGDGSSTADPVTRADYAGLLAG